jgi:glutamate 5-kinase
LQVNTSGAGTHWGTGGMVTKIEAAEIATHAGVRTVITHGRYPRNILAILNGERLGTQFEPQPRPFNARQRWIAHGLVPSGSLYLDDGAVTALRAAGKSLLAAGITQVTGEFDSQEAVTLCDANGQEIARGLVNYSSAELEKIVGCRSDEIPTRLGYVGADTIVHRDNLVLS